MSSQYKDLHERLYNLLPRVYRNQDINTKHQLKRYLEIITDGGLGPVYRDTQNLLNLIDFDRIPIKYLPFLASEMGFEFPYDLDEQTQRTYVKNAVISYKIKGTKSALEFMIRELTRFKTTLDIDNELKKIDVRLEVDMGRQDFDRVVEKVDFLVTEYAPPYKEYNLINTFLWDEGRVTLALQEWDTVVVFQAPTDVANNYDGWFLTNDYNSLTNSDILTAWGESYYAGIGEEYEISTLTLADDETYIPNASYEVLQTNVFYTDNESITTTKDDSGESIYVDGKAVDFSYNNEAWFGSNNGTSNETPTFSGETYHGEIGEEYTEKITFV